MSVRAAKVLFLVGLAVVPFLLLLVVQPFAQPLAYHNFADQREFCAIPNMLNVVSNFPFVLFGVWGLVYVSKCPTPERFQGPSDRWFYGVFFAAVALTGVGSAYYHWAPTNERLVWDRLPLALAFMAIFALMVAERINYAAGVALFFPLLIVGGGSVFYWHMTELRGEGDLRPYFLVQFYPLAAIPCILLLFPARFTLTQDLWAALCCYLLAKALELLDSQVYSQGQIVSGHTLKHLAAGFGPYFILHMIQHRRRVAYAT